MDSVTLEFLSEDRLSRTCWRFFLLHRTLIVDSYLEETRETTRKKFQKVRHWSRLFSNRAGMKMEEIPFTDKIAAQAKEAFIERIRNEVQVGFQK